MAISAVSDRQRSAGQRPVREQPVDGAFEIAAVRADGARDKGEHGRRNLERRLERPRRRDARLQDLQPQRLVERADLHAKPDAQARAHALVERFKIVRRTVGGHDHLAPGVEQSVERMTELGLDRLSLQELGVVENQQVDRSQPLLERDRSLRLERGDESVHELLGGQIDDRAPLLTGGMRDRLQQMGLAEADRRMNVERAKGRRSAAAVVGDALRGGKGELIRPPDLKSGEGQPPIEGRPGQGLADRRRSWRSAGRAAIGWGATAERVRRLRRRFRRRRELRRRAFDRRLEGRRASGRKSGFARPGRLRRSARPRYARRNGCRSSS